jgi:hypothetical protein
MEHRFLDYLDVDFKFSGKKTELWQANLAKSGIFPYLENGVVHWDWKPPEIWLTEETARFFDNLIVCKDHQPNDISHTKAIGLVKNAYLNGDYISGDTAIFDTSGLIDGRLQLSPDFIARVEPVLREINGVFVRYKQIPISVDHIALVERGRAGNDVALLHRLDTSDGTAIQIPVEFAKQKVEFMDEMEELKSKYNELLTKHGEQSAVLKRMQDSAQTCEALQEEIAKLQSDLESAKTHSISVADAAKDNAIKLASDALELVMGAKEVGLTIDISTAISDPLSVIKQIKDKITPGVEVSDVDLPIFIKGALAVFSSKTEEMIEPDVQGDPADQPLDFTPFKDSADNLVNLMTTEIKAKPNVLAQLSQLDRGLLK